MSRRITLEDAARAMLGRENDDEQEKSRSGGRPKITLPRVAWLEKPGPEWAEPPKPTPRRTAGRK